VFLTEMFDLRAKSWNTRKNCLWTMSESPYKIVWGCRTCGKNWNCCHESLK